MLTLSLCRALPKIVLRNKDLKKLFSRLATNFWYSVEDDVYLKASALLGSAVVTIKKIVRAAGTR